jgi:sec-independent protein translocase protein TatC
VFGLAFEVPIVVIVLAHLGIVPVEKLKAFRGYFTVVAFIVAAVVTPPDVISQLALAIPMIILYEIGLRIAQVFARKKEAESAQEAGREAGS